MAKKKIGFKTAFFLPIIVSLTAQCFWAMITRLLGSRWLPWNIAIPVGAVLFVVTLLGIFVSWRRRKKKEGVTGFTMLGDVYPHD